MEKLGVFEKKRYLCFAEKAHFSFMKFVV